MFAGWTIISARVCPAVEPASRNQFDFSGGSDQARMNDKIIIIKTENLHHTEEKGCARRAESRRQPEKAKAIYL